MTLHAVSLFAGIGGFEEALRRVGIPTVASVEIDTAARGVLHDRFPDTTLLNDITEVTGDQLRAAGLVPERGILTAGWPCQGNSVAGRRQGMDDPRSGLWRHVVRLLAETRPRWFLGENVPGLLSINDGLDFLTVIRDLDDLGYGVAWRVLDAQHIGVPQRRRRVILVGRLGDGAAPAQVLLEPEGRNGNPPARRTAGQVVATLTANGVGGGGGADDNSAQAGHVIPFDAAQITSRENRSNPRPGDPAPTLADTGQAMVAHAVTSHAGRNEPHAETFVAHTLTGGAQHRGVGQGHNTTYVAHTLTAEGHDASEDGTGRGTPLVGFHLTQDPISGDVVPAVVGKSGGQGVSDGTAVRRLTPMECERLQGFPDHWTATSWGKAQADSPRYRQCGNAVAVPVIEWVVRRVQAVDAGRWAA